MINKHLNALMIAFLILVAGLVASFFTVSQYTGVEAAGVDDFVITVQTDNEGTSADDQFTIPTFAGSTYNYDVDWGDGQTDLAVTGDITHTYGAPGSYTIRISGTFPRIYFNSTGDASKLVTIDQWGTIAWESMERSFYGCDNMNIVATDAPDLSLVTDMSYMFERASSLNADLDNWDVSNVERMERMFFNATSFNGNISTWNVGNLVDGDLLFYNAFEFNSDISGWDTSSLTNFDRGFFNARKFNQDLNNWDVSGLTKMNQLFEGANVFNGNISDWEVGQVTDMRRMFFRNFEFNQDLSGWDVSNVQNMSLMFYDCRVFDQPLNTWVTTSLTNIDRMFDGAFKFNQDLDNWDISGVSSLDRVFFRALEFNGNVSTWDVSNVTNMSATFKQSDFDGNISGWNVSLVEDMSDMFFETPFNQNINNWDVSNVTDMALMFYDADLFNQPLDEWDVSGVLDMQRMFEVNNGFNQDIGVWNVSNVQNMFQMFTGASAFDQDISGWDVSSVTNAANMLTSSGFSTKNYDVLLIEWSELDLQNGVSFGATGVNYCHGAEERAVIEAEPYEWIIIDDGLDCTEANQFPTGVLVGGLETGEFPENQGADYTVGLLTAVDVDEEDTHTFEKTCSVAGADDALFTVDENDFLVANADFNFEEPSDANLDSVYEVCVNATDDGKPNLTAEVTLFVTVTNVNEAPIDLRLNDGYEAWLNERRQPNFTIGTLTTDDNGEENPDGFVYTLSCSVQKADDAFFVTEDDKLKAKDTFYASTPRDENEDNIYEICVVTTDDGGLSFESEFTVEVYDIGTQPGSASSNVVESSSSGGGTVGESNDNSSTEEEFYEEQIDQEPIGDEIESTEVVEQNSVDGTTSEESLVEPESNTSTSSSGGGSNNFSNTPVRTFDPESINVTRGEFLKFMFDNYLEITGENLPTSGSEDFPDVEPSDELYWYVVLGSDKGVLLGDNGRAELDREIYRVEALAMALRLMEVDYESMEYTLNYVDVDTSDWFATVIEASIEAGLVLWVDENEFMPEKTLEDTEVRQLLDETFSKL